jgi:peptide/nickel transport system permease protein
MSAISDEAFPVASEELPTGHRQVTRRRRALRRFAHNRVAMCASAYLVVLSVLVVFASWFTPYSPSELVGQPFESPSSAHWLGTDSLGRDEFTRLLHGGQVTLGISVVVVAAVILLATPLGLISGYRGGRLDYLVMRLVDAAAGFPSLVLLMVIAGILGPGVRSTAIALTIVVTPGMMRVVRGQALAVQAETFVEASRGIGTPGWRIIGKRVLPGVASPVIVQATVLLGTAMLAEAALSFLGLGTQLPTPSWGNMLRDAYNTSFFSYPQLVAIPAAAIALTILAFNMIGDGLRDAFGIARQGPKGRSQRRGITTVDRAQPARVEALVGSKAGPPGPAEAEQAAKEGAFGDEVAPALLQVEDLTLEFASEMGSLQVLDGLNLTVVPGEVHCIVGESGCGKSVTCLSILRLLESPPARITGGRVIFGGRDLLSLSLADLRTIRGSSISMIFQDPMTSLDPAFTIGHHLLEAQRNHATVGRDIARKRAVEMLEMVEVPAAAERMSQYPHELSGGLRQRIMIAAALINRPKLLLADEPTTALDVTVQAQILSLLKSLQQELKMAILFVTHDLGVVADIADRVTVMYAGQIVEQAPAHGLFAAPKHPYTEGLLDATPRDDTVRGDRLAIIPGSVPMPDAYPQGCRFADRCEYATEDCSARPIQLQTVGPSARVRCIHPLVTHVRRDGPERAPASKQAET